MLCLWNMHSSFIVHFAAIQRQLHQTEWSGFTRSGKWLYLYNDGHQMPTADGKFGTYHQDLPSGTYQELEEAKKKWNSVEVGSVG